MHFYIKTKGYKKLDKNLLKFFVLTFFFVHKLYKKNYKLYLVK